MFLDRGARAKSSCRWHRRARSGGTGAGLTVLPWLGGCDILRTGFLNPQGPVAAGERHLFLVVVVVMLFVIGPVLLLTPVIAWHYRRANKDDAFRPKWDFSWTLEFLIWVPPGLIVAGLSFILWKQSRLLDPYTPIRPTTAPLEVQAVGLDWKWLFIYPELGVATLNELDIPQGRPVHISLTSATVMQSMMVPQLAGQIYAMAGMTTQLYLAADRPGTFTGLNTQYNGAGFQQQRFSVVSKAPAAFDQWLASVKTNGQSLDAATYERLLTRSTEPRPVLFSPVAPGLFRQIEQRSRAVPAVQGEKR